MAAKKKTTKKKTARGPVLVSMTLKEIKDYIGGDMNTPVMVGQKSLIDIKTRNARKEASALLSK